MSQTINIFDFHTSVMDRYKLFSKSFLSIDDQQIQKALQNEGHLKTMWPDPLIQFNPSYEQNVIILLDPVSWSPESMIFSLEILALPRLLEASLR